VSLDNSCVLLDVPFSPQGIVSVYNEKHPVMVQAVYDVYDTEPVIADVGDSPNCRFIFIGTYFFSFCKE
jgi:hypothetical protein